MDLSSPPLPSYIVFVFVNLVNYAISFITYGQLRGELIDDG